MVAVIDFKDKKQNYSPVDIRFSGSGEAFLVADTRGQVTMFQALANRYIVVCQSRKTHQVNFAAFTGKVPQDQVLVAFKDKSIETHALNGKLLERFAGAHAQEIRCLELNEVAVGGSLATVSADSCVIWAVAGANSVAK